MILQLLLLLGFATANPQPATEKVSTTQTILVVAPVNNPVLIEVGAQPRVSW